MNNNSKVVNNLHWENVSVKTIEGELWKGITGCEKRYLVSNMGRIKSLPKKVCRGDISYITKERILKQQLTNSGYLIVNIYFNTSNPTPCLIHRLVASSFISNKHDYPEVNHINEVKTDNRVNNLEWCSKIYNANYGDRNKNISNNTKGRDNSHLKRKVAQLSKEGKIIKKWSSLSHIYDSLGYHQSNISHCCAGKYKTMYGFIWQFI